MRRARQLAFFDYFLRQRPTALAAWPKVRIEVRERHGVAEERAEAEWPLARTRHQALHLEASTGQLRTETGGLGELRYDAAQGRVCFDWTFDEATELTGHASLRLWVEAEGSDDMDLFVALQKLDASGTEVGFTFYAFYENGPIALGWQRASHRALDAAASSPERPVHLHTREEPLIPGVPVPVDIELWPFSVYFAPGETLRLVIAGHDIYEPEEGVALPFPLHRRTRNAGAHILHTGTERDSFLLLPFVLPAR